MKKIISLTLCVIALMALLTSCNKESAPEGLQIVHSSSVEGFKFYAPEGWTIINTSYNADCKVYGAKLGVRGKTSITFIKAEKPENLAEYFTASLADMPAEVQISQEIKDCTFGNSAKASKVIYTYKYNTYDYQKSEYVDTDFTCMQIFVERGDDFYIFTYTAPGTPSDDEGAYQSYLEYVQKAIDAFVFIDKSGEPTAPTYEKDKDGYNLVSDKTLCGFSLYLPQSFKVASNDGDVEARVGEGATVSLTRAVYTGVTDDCSISDYWKLRKDELSRIVGEINVIEFDVINKEGDVKVKLGNLEKDRVASYTYTYEYGGVTYKVYQVMGINTMAGFVFTYTAPIDEFETHLDEIKIILDKVQF